MTRTQEAPDLPSLHDRHAVYMAQTVRAWQFGVVMVNSKPRL